MSFWVYMLKCRDGTYYTGHTDDLEARLWQHQEGFGADWTRRRRPVELVWCELMPTRDEAFTAERMIKPWSRAKKEALIAGDWEKVGYFAKPPHERSSLETHESSARPERSRGALAQIPTGRPSTTLGTSDEVGSSHKGPSA